MLYFHNYFQFHQIHLFTLSYRLKKPLQFIKGEHFILLSFFKILKALFLAAFILFKIILLPMILNHIFLKYSVRKHIPFANLVQKIRKFI